MPSDARQSQQFRIFYFFSSNKNLCCVINTLCSTLFLIFASLLLIFPWYHGETNTKGDVFQVSFFSVHTSKKHLCNGIKSDEMTFFLRTVTQLERVQHRNEFVYNQFFCLSSVTFNFLASLSLLSSAKQHTKIPFLLFKYVTGFDVHFLQYFPFLNITTVAISPFHPFQAQHSQHRTFFLPFGHVILSFARPDFFASFTFLFTVNCVCYICRLVCNLLR